eukprot:TRINITY_DN10005_c0_g1_i2.p1 TRINITY_DN10005_c0_g1~~TRINITY_DN10005_c0_g1_i2.p1  ORF type:complete len:107 (-),score=20.66 TRINITY_DN10005_c0_g1_i2:317-637(-)
MVEWRFDESQVMKLLQDKRINPSIRFGFRYTALGWFSSMGYSKAIDKILQDDRIDPSANQNEAICWACKNGYFNIVCRLLQDKRVDPSVRENMIWKWSSYYFKTRE